MGDDFVIDWTRQSVSINASTDVRTTAGIVAERLGIEFDEGVDHNGDLRFAGLEVGEVELDGEFSASYILPDDAVAVLRQLHREWLTR
ncbi:hypothetical protein ACWGE0_28230 [Lentzea sp. NPDC054927]